MFYGKYKHARDVAWRVLIDNNVTSLPVKVTAIARAYGLSCISYSQGNELIAAANLTHHAATTDGFLLRQGQRGIIFYNDQCSRQRCRFTIAHELGHWLLGHSLVNDTYTVINREPRTEDKPEEQEANIFASRLLAPACVLWALDIHTPEEIAKLCDISLASGQFRSQRMKALYEREQEFLRQHGKSCFLLSPIERAVHHQFTDFINQHLPKE